MKQRRQPIPQPKRPFPTGSKQPGAAALANDNKLDAALAMHQQGQLDQAEALYKEILQSQPRHFDALRLLATIAAQLMNSAAAVDLFEQALKINPNHAGLLNNRGNALLDLKRHKEAVESYDRALKIEPDYAEALNNRGTALADLKRHEEAVESYDRALKIKPDYAEACYNRGIASRGPERAERNIIVSSNCQTGGLAAALQALCPRDNIEPIPLPEVDGADVSPQLVDALKRSDVWVAVGRQDLVQRDKISQSLRYIRVPVIHFSAFHPDLCYVKKRFTRDLIMPHYNSAIAVWAYKNRLGVQDAQCLFNARTYAALGYFDEWDRSVAVLKGLFDDCSLNFNRFFLGVKRDGVFMYSTNHPKATTLVKLAKLVALELGQSGSVWEKSIDINDGLSAIIWPLYPEIADHYALPGGSYDWKMDGGRWLIGLEEYLEYAFENYARQGIAPDDLVYFDKDAQMYDRVLGGK